MQSQELIQLPKDLREMNEEQFAELYNYLKDKTSNFQEFPADLFIENNQYLLVIRCVLGLSQKELANKLECTKDWVRHTEAGRNKIIHLKPALRWAPKINKLLQNSKNLPSTESLNFWTRYIFASKEQNLLDIKNKKKSISKINEKELKNWFNEISRKTNNFTTFNPKILIENPQNLLIFRLVLKMDHRAFAEKLNCSPRGLRKWEHLEMKMKSYTAKEKMSIIKDLFYQINPETSFQRVLFNFRSFTNYFGNRNLESNIKRGLNFAKMQKLSNLEDFIYQILKKEQISFETHGEIDGFKRKFNVDFIFPNAIDPKVLLETFDFSLRTKQPSHSKMRICHNDHRFQMIKMEHPNIKCITFIRFNGKPIDENYVQKSLELEIVNTDSLIINKTDYLLDSIRNWV